MPGGCCTPIIIDVAGDGFDLTSRSGVVVFDFDANGHAGWIPWTATGSDDAWLVLDRNANGIIDDGTEFFGSLTPQPSSEKRNGFIALAEYDKPEQGGNGDGLIDSRDAIFPILRLWQDTNHNSVSDAGELHTLSSLKVVSFSLDYHESFWHDLHGNWFRYRAPVVIDDGRILLGRYAWDVFLSAPW
jgi:hypothetical protein